MSYLYVDSFKTDQNILRSKLFNYNCQTKWFFVAAITKLLQIYPYQNLSQSHLSNSISCYSNLICVERRRRTRFYRSDSKIKKILYNKWNIFKKNLPKLINNVKTIWLSHRRRFSICKMYSIENTLNKLLIWSMCLCLRLRNRKEIL